MEPITILIYLSIVFVCIIGTLLSIILFRLVRVFNKIDRIITYGEHISDLLESWEQIPIKFFKWILDRVFKSL